MGMRVESGSAGRFEEKRSRGRSHNSGRDLARPRPPDREPLLRIGPVAGRFEAGFAQQGGEAFERVLVRILGVNALAFGETALAAFPSHGQRLTCLQMHLDA